MVAPPVVSVVEDPLQMVPARALPVTVGRAVTPTAMVIVPEQEPLNPVTV